MKVFKNNNTTMFCLRLLFPLFICSVLIVPSSSQDQERYPQDKERLKGQYEQVKDSLLSKYEKQRLEQEKRYFQLKEEIERRWGKYLTATKKNWFEYSHGGNTRALIDFESGTVTIETILADHENVESNTVISRLDDAIHGVVTSTGGPVVLEKENRVYWPRFEKPVMTNQIQLQNGTVVDVKNVASLSTEVISGKRIKSRTLSLPTGERKGIATVSFPLVPNHLQVRVRRYASLIKEYCRRFDLRADMVYAIIHTESYFNPYAQSSAGAYGLMQLVPSSGATEGHARVYGEEVSYVSPATLYNPDENIKLGCAYLSVLESNQFRGIKDKTSRMYCQISAYNTGPSNVALALTGTRDLTRCAREVNSMTPDQVFSTLLASLPARETREYLANVTRRMDLYASS